MLNLCSKQKLFHSFNTSALSLAPRRLAETYFVARLSILFESLTQGREGRGREFFENWKISQNNYIFDHPLLPAGWEARGGRVEHEPGQRGRGRGRGGQWRERAAGDHRVLLLSEIMQHLRISSTRTGARAAATSCATARPWSPWTSSTTSGASRWRLDHHCVGHLSEIMEHYRSARRARCCCTASTWATRGGPTARGAITRSSVCGAPTATGNTYYMLPSSNRTSCV